MAPIGFFVRLPLDTVGLFGSNHWMKPGRPNRKARSKGSWWLKLGGGTTLLAVMAGLFRYGPAWLNLLKSTTPSNLNNENVSAASTGTGNTAAAVGGMANRAIVGDVNMGSGPGSRTVNGDIFIQAEDGLSAAITPGTNGPPIMPGPFGPNAFALLMGNQENIVSHLPQTIVQQGNEEIIKLGGELGKVWLSGKFFSREGKVLAEVISNTLLRNPNNTFRLEKSQHHLVLFNDELRPVLRLNFVNRWLMVMEADVYLRNGIPFVANSNGVSSFNSRFSGFGIANALSGNAGAFFAFPE